MGGESSTLNSVKCLDTTLESIEERLFDIEDTYLRHENSVVLDNCIIVADKVISCNPNVKALVVPILGRMDASSVRVGIEVNKSTILEFHIFTAETSYINCRFVRSISKHANGGQFQTFLLDGLDCQYSYMIYVGGLCKDDVVANVLHINLPRTESSSTKFYIINSSGIDNSKLIGEKVWNNIAADCSDQLKSKICKVIIHIGNFIRLSSLLRHKIVRILQYICGDDFSTHHWEFLIADFESTICTAYRHSFQCATIIKVLQHCSSYFGVGEGESMVEDFVSFTNQTFTTEWMIRSDGQNGGRPTHTRSKGLQDDFSATRSIFSSSVLSERGDNISKSKIEIEEVATMKNMVLSLLARIVRKIYWLYCLQLWDDTIVTSISQSSIMEEKLSKIISLKKRIHSLSKLSNSLVTLSEQLSNEVEELNQSLVTNVCDLGEFVSINSSSCNTMTTFHLGSMMIVCWETGWNWILSNGNLSIPIMPEVEIGQEMLDYVGNSLINHVNPVKGVLVIGRHILISAQSQEDFPLGGLIHNSKVSASDTKKLVHILGQWQMEDSDRAALIVTPNDESGVSTYGMIQNIGDDAQRQQIAFLIIGCASSLSSFRGILPISWEAAQLPKNVLKFTTTVDSFRGYFLASLQHISLSTANKASENGVYKGRAAYFKVYPRSIAPQRSEILNIMVGQVTSTGGIILVESLTPFVGQIHCIDGITGVDHVVTFSFTSLAPQPIHFRGLHPNRNYDVFIYGTSAWANFTTLKDVRLLVQPTDFEVESRIRNNVEDVGVTQSGLSASRTFRIIMFGGIASNAFDRDLNYDEFTRHLFDSMAFPWNGYDLIIHGSCAVDYGSSLNHIVQLFQQESAFSKSWENESLESLRNCFRLHRSSGLLPSSMISHLGSHFYVSSPIIELIDSWGVSSINDVKRELSPELFDHVVKSLECIHDDYYGSLWDGSKSKFFSVRVMDTEKILIVEIKPSSLVNNRWLGAEHYSQMKVFLEDRSLMQRYQTVIILTAAPVVTCDQVFYQYSSLSTEQHIYHPHVQDTADILDFCAEVILTHLQKEVVLLSSHKSASFSTTIRFESKMTAGSNIVRAIKPIRQYCVGPFSGNCEVLPYPKTGIVSNNHWNFIFEHDFSVRNYSICELLVSTENEERSVDINFVDFSEFTDPVDCRQLLKLDKLEEEDCIRGILLSLVDDVKFIWNFDHVASTAVERKLVVEVVQLISALFDGYEELLMDVFRVVPYDVGRKSSIASKLSLISSHIVQRIQLVHPGVLRRPSNVVVALFLNWVVESRMFLSELVEAQLLYLISNSFEDFKKVVLTLAVAQLLLEDSAQKAGMVD